MIGLGLSVVQLAVRQLVGSFTPASLFANSEPGVWYDPSDLTTLFQDSSGTTPVTAVEQPVGLMLDKSNGLVLGPELVTNGDFSNGTTGWSAFNAVISNVSNTLKVDDSANAGFNSAAVQQLSLTSGKWYKLTVDVVSTDANGWNFSLSPNATSVTAAQGLASGTTTGTKTAYFLASTNTYLYISVGGTGVSYFDNISVRELPGNHAFQTTSTKRPVLSRRVNLLTKTEQFDDGAWTKTSVTVTANAAIAPDGTMTADKVVQASGTDGVVSQTGISFIAGVSYKASIRAKKELYDYVLVALPSSAFPASNRIGLFNLATGQVASSSQSGINATITPLGNGWYECSITQTANNTGTSNFALGPRPTDVLTSTGDGTSGIYTWGASLVPADQASIPYQRVNTSTDYDADPTKFPAYLKGDSVSGRAMVTNTITPGTDKVQVFAGVRKLSDAAFGVVVDLTSDPNTVAGGLAFGSSTSIGDASRRTWGSFIFRSNLSGVGARVYTSPITNVASSQMDFAATTQLTQHIVRVNGATPTLSADGSGAAATAGNFANAPLYIFARNQTSLYFTGHLYSLIVRFGPNLPTATIEQVEDYVAQKTGITL